MAASIGVAEPTAAPAAAADPADAGATSADKPAQHADDAAPAKAERKTFGPGERRVYPIEWLKLIGREFLLPTLIPPTVASSDVNKHSPAEYATSTGSTGGGGAGGLGGGLGGGLSSGGGLDMARAGRTVPERPGGGGLFPERGSALGRVHSGGGVVGGSGGGGGGDSLDMADPRGTMRLGVAGAANGGSGTGRAAPAPPRSGGMGVLGSYTAPLPSRSTSSLPGGPEPDFRAARGSMKVLPPPSSPVSSTSDLSTARTPRTGGMAPAGGGGGSGGGAFGSGRRGGGGAGGYADMFDPRGTKVHAAVVAPQPELKKSSNAWARNREADDEVEAKVKKVRSLLNKLTLEKFNKIYDQIKAIEVSSPEVLDGIVSEVFQKALSESNFAGMYADLCSRLSKENFKLTGSMADAPESEKQKLNFRRLLITNCQSEFDRFANEETIMSDLKVLEDGGNLTSEELMKVVTKAREKKSAAMNEFVDKLETISKQDVILPADISVVISRAKRRMLGNVMFIGELFKKKLILEKIIHTECIQRLLTIVKAKKEEDVVEALIQLVSTTGKLLSMNAKAKSLMDDYFKDFALLSRDKEIPSRVRFLLKDLLDLRSNNWQGRRDEGGAKTIAEIHADIEKEEQAKEASAAAASAKSRDSRGFGGGARGGYGMGMRGPIPTSHHTVSMHMPSSMRAGGAGATGTPPTRNRLSAAWEIVERKEAAAAATSMSADAAQVTLRPGGLRPGGGGLRPGSRSRGPTSDARAKTGLLANSFAQLADNASGTPVLRPGGRAAARPGAAGGASVPKAAPAAPAAPPGLSKEVLKRKTKSILSEYVVNKDVKEARECVKEDIPVASHTGFVQTAMRHVLELRVQEREVMLPLFEHFASSSTLPHAAFVDAFTDVVRMLDDLDIDDPKACEYVGKFLGRLAALGAFTPETTADAAVPVDAGLGFLGAAVKDIENPGLTIKLVVGTFSNFKAALVAGAGDRPAMAENEANAAAVAAYAACGVDLEALAAAVPGGSGDKVLNGALDRLNMAFLLPVRAAGGEVAKRLRDGVSVEDVRSWIDAEVSADVRTSPAFVRTLAAAAIGVAVAPTLSAGERNLTAEVVAEEARLLKTAAAPLLLPLVEGNMEAQVTVLLQVQAICYAARFPGAGTLTGADGKPLSPLVRRLFDGLYDLDVIDEESANAWKDRDPGSDDSGKTEALVQTNAWFEWLATAEEEDDK